MNNESYWFFWLVDLHGFFVDPEKRRLRRLLAVVVVVVLLAGGGLGGRWYQIHRKFVRFRAEGMAAAQTGDARVAVDRLGKYLDSHPADEEALVAYCRVRPTLIDPDGRYVRETIAALQRLLTLDGKLVEQRRALMRLYVEHGPAGAASEEAARLLAQVPDDSEALEIHTRDAVLHRQLEEALASDAHWRRVAPIDLPTEFAILELIRATPKPAEQLIARSDSERAAHPDEPASWVLAARGYAMAGNAKPEIQAKLLAKAVERVKGDETCAKDGALAVALAEQLDYCGQFTDAVDVLARCATVSRDQRASWALGRRLWIAGRWEEADSAFGTPSASAPSEVLALSAISAARAGRRETADRLKAELERRHDDLAATCKSMVNWATGSSPRSAGDATDLLTILHKTPASAGDGRDWAGIWWYFVGEAQAALGENDLARGAWERAAVCSPAWAMPLLRLAPLLSESGQWEAAFRLASDANRRAPRNIAAALALAQTWLKALDCAGPEGAVSKTATAPSAARVTADGLLELLDSILKQVPADEQALCLRIQFLARQESTRSAAVSAMDAMMQKPAALSLAGYLRLAEISQSAHLGKEEQCLRAAERQFGLNPQIALARSTLQLQASDGPHHFGKAMIPATRPSNAQDALEWESARIRALELAGAAEAPAAIAAFADAHPDSLVAQREVLASFVGRSDPALLARVVERMRRLTGEQGLEWRLAKVRLLLLQSARLPDSLKEAQELLEGILTEARGSVEAHALLAELYEARHDLTGAAREWSRTAALAPDSAAIAMSRAKVLRETGDPVAATAALARLTQRPPPQLRERAQLARLLADCGQLDRAIEVMLPIQMTGSAAQVEENGLLLAALYRRAGRLEDSQRISERLLKTPSLAVVVFASDLLASQGKAAQSIALLESLDALKLPAGTKQLAIAGHAAKFEGAQAAIPLYRAACDAAPSSAAAWKGLIACCVATGMATEAKAAAFAGAAAVPADEGLRRLNSDPTLLSAASDPDLRNLVIAVVEDPEEDGAAVRALRICAGRKGPPEAIAAQLEELSSAFPTLAPLQFLAIKHDLAARRFARAVALAERSVRLFPTSPDSCRWLVLAHAASAEWADALTAAEQWRSRLALQPAAQSQLYDADLARAECMSWLGRREEAVATLEPHAARVLANPKANVPWIRLYLTCRLARRDAGALAKVCDLLRPLLQNPDGREVWIRLAADIPDADFAAAWLAAASDAVPSDDVKQRVWLAEAWHKLLFRHPNTDCAARERAALGPLVDRPAPAPQAVFALANFAEQEGELAQAQASYRRVLALNAGENLENIRPIAANNLANLLLHGRAADNDVSEALSLARDAVKAKPDVAAFHDTLAAAYARARQYPLAAAELGNAIHLEPQFKYQVRLARVLADGGNTEDARQLVEKLQNELGAGVLAENALAPPDRADLQLLSRQLGRKSSAPTTKDAK